MIDLDREPVDDKYIVVRKCGTLYVIPDRAAIVLDNQTSTPTLVHRAVLVVDEDGDVIKNRFGYAKSL